MKNAIGLFLLLITTGVQAQVGIVRSGDSCPSGWYKEGAYCIMSNVQFTDWEKVKEQNAQERRERQEAHDRQQESLRAQCTSPNAYWDGYKCKSRN